MKKLIAACLMLFSGLAFGLANDLGMDQRNATDTGWLTRTLTIPAGGANGIIYFNGTTVRPGVLTLGTGLTITDGVLSAASAGQVNADWNATSGAAQILNRPTLAPVATSGDYDDLNGLPSFSAVATTGSYNSLTDKPSIPAAQVQTDWNASSGLGVLLNKPSLSAVATSGAYADLSGKPSIPAAQVNSDWSASSGVAQVLNKPTTLSGYGITDAYPLSGNPSGFVAQAGARSAISLTTTGTSGAATYNSSTGVLNVPNYAPGTGTVTSVTAGAGLSGGTITTSGTVSMPSVGTAGTYANVTTDAQGRVTAGTTISINDAPGRSLVTSTSATGFQVSATRIAQVCYEGSFSTTSTIGGPSSASVFLETADTNSTTPGDWTVKATQTYSNTITLAVVLNQVQGNNWAMCRYIPAGKYVRIRSGSITGTASASINSQQQETLL